MADRIILGPDYGFKISRPARSVFSSNIDDLLFDGTRSLLQVVQHGVVHTNPNSASQQESGGWCYIDVPIVDQGFLPLVLLGLRDAGMMSLGYNFRSNSMIRIASFFTIGPYDADVAYIVTNQRFN